MTANYQPYTFEIEGVEDRDSYAAGYPYVVSYGLDEDEARAKAQEFLDPGETLGTIRSKTSG